jgi:hypothetical protein
MTSKFTNDWPPQLRIRESVQESKLKRRWRWDLSPARSNPQIASCIAEAEKAGEQLSDLPKFWK